MSSDEESNSNYSYKSTVETNQSDFYIVDETDDEDIAQNTDEEEKLTEVRCFSPHTRRSITGKWRSPTIKYDNSSDDEDSFRQGRTNVVKKKKNVINDSSEHESEEDYSSKSNLEAINSGCSIPSVEDKQSENFIDSQCKQDNDSSCNNQTGSVSGKNIVIELSDDEENGELIEHVGTPTKKINLKPIFSASTPVTIKFVSKEYFKRQELKRHTIIEEIMRLNSLRPLSSHLPDDGVRLQEKIKSLEMELSAKTNEIECMRVEAIPAEDNNSTKSNVNRKDNSWNDIAAAVEAVAPKYTGKIGLQNFNANKAETIECLKNFHECLTTMPTEYDLANQPKILKINLMPHQLCALKWMLWREKQKPRGGILADDMGLGKTLTTISLVAIKNEIEDNSSSNIDDSDDDDDDDTDKSWHQKNKRSVYQGGTLIICPASVMNQWENEVQKHVKRNSLSICVHHGYNRERKARVLSRFDIVVTSYAISSRENQNQGVLFDIKWERIVLDEAHIIRNYQTNQAKSCFNLKGRHRWALTGTPIQNKDTDLFSLLKFLKCSPFDEYANYKSWLCSAERLNTILQPLMLRRTKQQLQQNGELGTLPEKTIEEINVLLSTDEMKVYQKILCYSKTLFAQFLAQKGDRVCLNKLEEDKAFAEINIKLSKFKSGSEVEAHQILTLILRLRQICCHPGLIDAMLDDDETEQNSSVDSLPNFDLLEKLQNLHISDNDNNEAMSRAISKILCRTNPVFDLKRPSAKLQTVIRLLDEKILPTNDKVVIVSQWTSVLQIVSAFLSGRCIKHLELTGSTPVKGRSNIVNEFNAENSKQILLLSLTAGGVGLNLTGANHLIIMDPHWNPQLELQAQDRINRVGQKKPIFIYKVICKDTIEERIKGLQTNKMAIAHEVLTGVKQTSNKLSIEDMKSLFGF